MELSSLQAGWKAGHASADDGTQSHIRTSDTNDSFFMRPVKILSTQWKVATQLYLEFNPWRLFCEDPRIGNRLAHFRNLRMKLHVQAIINGNPFYYGKAIMCYTPLPDPDSVTSFSSGDTALLVEMSQKPHVFLDPTRCEGGELELPFIWPKTALNIVNAEWRSMGVVQLRSFNSLQHANAVTDPVNITIFAYASDVELFTPTSRTPLDLVPQGGDEYGRISMPAHLVTKVAGVMSKVPMIAPFARATEMVSTTIRDLALLFGYSRPRMVPEDLALVQHYGSQANVNAVDTSLSLALDAKKEITIDPRVTGCAPVDDMAFSNIAQRESYLDTFVWRETEPTETHLYSLDVTPALGRVDSQGLYHLTPMAFVALPFEFWKGSISVRMQIVASAYHRGRLRVVWDPDYVNTSSQYNVNYSMMLDITESSEVTFKIGWGQEVDYLRIGNVLDIMDDRSPLSDQRTKIPWVNGRLSVYVVNPLTSPGADTTYISINTFVSACDDFEVASPTDTSLKLLKVARFIPRAPDSSDSGTVLRQVVPGPIGARGSIPPIFVNGTGGVPQGILSSPNQTNLAVNLYSPTATTQNVVAELVWSRGAGTIEFKSGSTTQTITGTVDATTQVAFDATLQPGWNFFPIAIRLLTGASPIFAALNSLAPRDAQQIVLTPTQIIPLLKFVPGTETTANPLVKTITYPAVPTTRDYLEVQPVQSFRISLPGWMPGTSVGITVATNMELSGCPMVNYYNSSPGNDLLGDQRLLTVTPSIPEVTLKVSEKSSDNPKLYQITSVTYMKDINFTPQGGEEGDSNVNAPEAEPPEFSIGPSSEVRGLNDIYFGERATSIRQVLKRFETAYFLDNPDGTTPASYVRITIPHYPSQVAFFPNQPGGWAYTSRPNLFTYFTSAFVCMRGGTRVKLLQSKKGTGQVFENGVLTRYGTDVNQPLGVSIISESTTSPAYKLMKWSGTAVDYTANKPYTEFELPYYSHYRFTPARSVVGFDRSKFVERPTYIYEFGQTTVNNLTTVNYAVAEDFSLSFFLACPIVQRA